FAVILVAKGYGLKSQDSFARVLHRFDLFLEFPCRRWRLGPEPAITVDVHRLDRSTLAHGIDASDKRSGVSTGCAEPNLPCVARYPCVTNVYVVTARGEIDACL